MVSGSSVAPFPGKPKRLSLASLGLHKSVYLYTNTRTSQRERRGPRFRSPKRLPRLSKVCKSLRTSFKNQRYTDAASKVGQMAQNGPQNRPTGPPKRSRTSPRTFQLATAAAPKIGPPKISGALPSRKVFTSNFGPNRLARLYIYICIYIYIYYINVYI